MFTKRKSPINRDFSKDPVGIINGWIKYVCTIVANVTAKIIELNHSPKFEELAWQLINFLISALEGIPGVGPKRRRDLLKHFGGIVEVKKASVADLMKVSNINKQVAESIYAELCEEWTYIRWLN